MTHHGNQHVDENDDDGDMVESEQEHADPFDDGRRRVTTRKTIDVQTASFLRRVLDLDTVDADEAEHRPEQREQCPRQSGGKRENSR